jgi:hypothetical protein
MTKIMLNEKYSIYITIYFLFYEQNSENKTVEKNGTNELVPEPDKYLKEEYENQEDFCLKLCFLKSRYFCYWNKSRNGKCFKVLGQKTKLERRFNSRFLLK